MHAALMAVPAVSDAIPFPLVLTVALATVALVGIALFVRLARRSGRLTGVTATASGVSAAGIIASAILVLVSFGGATSASAAPMTSHGSSSVESPAGTTAPLASPDGPSGYQLPTK
jgi:hypothetical protein